MFISIVKNMTNISSFIFSFSPPYFSFGIININNTRGKYTILQHAITQDNMPIIILCFLLSSFISLLNARFNIYAIKK